MSSCEELRVYDGMRGRDFMVAFFRDHGITEEEIEWYGRWGGYPDDRIKADAEGLQYAQERVNSIIEYRTTTPGNLWEKEISPPWEWHYAKDFQRVVSIEYVPISTPVLFNIYCCLYDGKEYYYGIGKEETPITQDMRENGAWLVYTWTD